MGEFSRLVCDGLLDIFPSGMGGIDGDDKPSVVTHRTFEISANFWFGPHLPGALCPLKHLNAMEVGRGGMNGGRERNNGLRGGLMPFMTTGSNAMDPTVRLQ